ncbi:MAG: hypothetical protein LBH12_04845 [Dysgonamonadaceae bacterium]|nr:hypothetical protein [Dysgonamonadaceae bacterium]
MHLLMPIMGMMPLMVFFLFNSFSSYNVTLIITVISLLVSFPLKGCIFKQKINFTVYIATISIFLLVLFSLFSPFDYLYETKASVFLGIFLSITLFVFLRLKDYFKIRILQKDGIEEGLKILQLDTEFYVVKLALYIQGSYLLVTLFYQLLPDNYHSSFADFCIYHGIVLLFIFAHIIYEFSHWNFLKKRLSDEIWLPIVNESGAVKGKVALSVSLFSGNKYLHPVVRVALINKGKLFLQERKDHFLNQVHQLDYPFERSLLFEETLDEGVKKAITKNGGSSELPYRFIFRYVYKDSETNRLIYLYACNILDDKLLDYLHLETGKWWLNKQIEENLNTGLFSPYFEKEYELLNTTVLMAERLMQEHEREIEAQISS